MVEIQKPIIKWAGGKHKILEDLFLRFPPSFNNYHEIFLGGGSVLLSLLYRIQTRQIQMNGIIYAYDKNSVLIQMYKNIQLHPKTLIEHKTILFENYNNIDTMNGIRKPSIETCTSSKESYYYWIRNKYNCMTDDEKHSCEGSAIFMFLNKTCFRGLYRIGPNGFNVPFGNYKNPNISDDHIIIQSRAIQNVVFRCTSFTESLAAVQQGDFVYLDPPYVPISKTSFVGYLSGGFKEEEHTRLFELIKSLREKNVSFLMSNSNTDQVRDAFHGFETSIIDVRLEINSKKPGKKASEVIIKYWV